MPESSVQYLTTAPQSRPHRTVLRSKCREEEIHHLGYVFSDPSPASTADELPRYPILLPLMVLFANGTGASTPQLSRESRFFRPIFNVGGTRRSFPLRFAHSGTLCCVVIGTETVG